MPDADTATMFDVMDYLEWAIMSNLPLKFELSEDDVKWIHASVNNSIWRDHLAFSELNTLPAYEFFQQLSEFVDILNGDDVISKPYFMEYFDGTTFPKFIYYSGHSETIYPFLNTFGYSPMEEPQAASAMFIEFFNENSIDYVRVIFKPNPTDEIVIPTHWSRADGAMLSADFKQFVDNTIADWNKTS